MLPRRIEGFGARQTAPFLTVSLPYFATILREGGDVEQDDYDNKNKKREAETEEALDDHNAELSETKSGYNYRTSAATDDGRPDIRAKKARKADTDLAQLSALQQFLTDPEYAEAYQTARDTIADFKEHMTERLEQIDQRIEALDEKLGNHAPGSPEYKRLIREREDLQRKQQELLDYYNDTIRPIEERMDDPDNPPTKEELDEFNDKVQQKMDQVFNDLPPIEPLAEPKIVKTSELEIPTL